MPLFRDEAGKLKDAPTTFVVDGSVENVLIARVPVTTTMREAKDIEVSLIAQHRKPVLVLTENIELCRLEQLAPEDIGKILKEGDGAGIVETLEPDEVIPEGETPT